MRSVHAATALVLATSVLQFSNVSGQQHLPIGGAGPTLQLEATKPFVSQDGPFAGARFASSGWDASLAYPLSGGPTLFGRMGLTYAAIDGLDGSLTLSNPRLGALFGTTEGGRRAEVHVDLPLASEFGEGYSTGMAIFSGYHELEHYELDSWAVGASASAEIEPGPGAFLGVRGGMTLLIPTSGARDAFALLALFAHAPTDRTRFRFEFIAHGLLTESGAEVTFSDRTTFFGSLDVMWPFTRFSPTLFVRAPVDDTLDGTVPFVAGLRLLFGR
jgi:hypothetical protein